MCIYCCLHCCCCGHQPSCIMLWPGLVRFHSLLDRDKNLLALDSHHLHRSGPAHHLNTQHHPTQILDNSPFICITLADITQFVLPHEIWYRHISSSQHAHNCCQISSCLAGERQQLLL
jgi:hypothetical protein